VSDPVSIVVPRLDRKPWGGRALERFGLDLPGGEPVGEAVVTAGDATVSRGYGAGRTLGEIVQDDPQRHLGARARSILGGRSLFPLLVKLIDAGANLSIQVHPDDAGAAPYDSPGKTEAWHVLAAKPGARLFAGLRPGVELDAFMATAEARDGSPAKLMRSIPAVVGTTIMLPAGTVHALGAGVVVYEIQQPSDLTFRLDDWGRTDAQGRSRDLHFDQGRDAARPWMVPEVIRPVRCRTTIGERHLLTACGYFALERVALPVGGVVSFKPGDSPVVVTVLSGSADLGGHPLRAGQSGVIWPVSDGATSLGATAPMVALIGRVPDLTRDVVDVGRAAGAEDDAIAALGGPLNDVGTLLARPRDSQPEALPGALL
jgi:mannose-6-phosphate isomerase